VEVSDLELTATVPAGASTGPIAVTTAAGTGTSAGSFTVVEAPEVTSFTPASGPVGTVVTISGTGFTGATSVTFDGTSASFAEVSDLELTATVPAGATSGPIAVTTPAGAGTSAASFTVVVTVCSNGLDDDGDGFTDHPADPGCASPTSSLESPKCQDGVDNDGDGLIDFDGGASLNGGTPLTAPDPNCSAASRNAEKKSSCGLGFEVALVLPALLGLRNRRDRRRRPDGPPAGPERA
jgi:hypothetical protein